MYGKITMWLVLVMAVCGKVTSLSSISKGEHSCGACCLGPPGPQGLDGRDGRPGMTGLIGQKGDRGEKGYQGEKGSYGPKGEAGDKGSRGKLGIKGQCGAKGMNGDKGQQGHMGPFGPKGDKGMKGDKCVATPQIAFMVTRTSTFGPVQQDTNIEFDKVFLNRGNSFDEHASQFVCRINGTYLFNAHILSQEDKDAFVVIMYNEQPRIPMHGDHRSGYGVASNTAIFHLNVGDKVYLRLKKDSAISNDSSTFSGYLIYVD